MKTIIDLACAYSCRRLNTFNTEAVHNKKLKFENKFVKKTLIERKRFFSEYFDEVSV